MTRIFYVWRLAMTGLAFAMFGVGALVLSVCVFPLLWLLPGSAEARTRRIRTVLQAAFTAFIGFLRVFGVMRLHIVHPERLLGAGEVIVLANHPTYLDVVVLLSLIPGAACVVKASHWRHPCYAGVMRAARYVSNGTHEELIDGGSRALQTGNPLLIFPEGTRSTPGEPVKFLRGGAHVALSSGKPILPILIYCDPPTLSKQHRWYHIPDRPFHIRVVPLPAVNPAALVVEGRNEATPVLAARHMTEALENFFMQQLDAHGPA
jgi:1-acyl-sn-glycerol-3-phosphate acyltransferase